MRHQKSGTKLNRTGSHRNAMFRNMVTSLFQHGQIRTTDAKAKELRRWADRMVTLAKRGDLHARRQALAVMRDKTTVHKLFEDATNRFGDRAGGYTNVIKIGKRRGDAAPMSLVELVKPMEKKEKKKKPKAKKKAVDKAVKAAAVTAPGKEQPEDVKAEDQKVEQETADKELEQAVEDQEVKEAVADQDVAEEVVDQEAEQAAPGEDEAVPDQEADEHVGDTEQKEAAAPESKEEVKEAEADSGESEVSESEEDQKKT